MKELPFKQLVIIGDSFCADRDTADCWPRILSNLLNLPLHGIGRGGHSWWTTREWIIKNQKLLDSTTLLIVCHTEYSRIPACNDLAINAGLLRCSASDSNNHLKPVDPNGDLHKLVNQYYLSDLYNENFFKWAMNAWLQELDQLLTNVGQVIHVPSFGHDQHSYFSQIKNGIVAVPTTNSSLRELSMRELGNKKYFGYDSRKNHLNAQNNCMLAQALAAMTHTTVVDSPMVEYNNLAQWDFSIRKFEPRPPAR